MIPKSGRLALLILRYVDDEQRFLPGRVKVVAVSVEAKIDYLGLKRTIRDTVYWMKLGGQWRGLWEPDTFRAYKAHRCPD